MSYTLSNGTSSATANSSNGTKSHLVYGLSSPIESAASSALGDQGAAAASTSAHLQPENGYARTPYASPSSHNEETINHLYQYGFQMGNYADTILNVHGRQYRLHAILLSRSPYLAHLMSTFPSNSPMRNIYVPIEEEPEVTEEGFAIALGYLYSSISLELITPTNARSVLAAACFLGGLPDLCAYAYETCRDSISTETIEDWLRFVEGIPPPPEEGGPSDIPTSLFGPYAAQLRADILHFLVTTMPHTLQAFSSTESSHVLNGKSNGLQTLLQIYTHVPFDMFKQAVESPELPVGSEQARFQFAKAAIARRKATVGNAVEETVVLAFGGSTNSGSAVHVTRKVKRRPLMPQCNDLYFFNDGQMQNNPRHVSILGYEGDRPLFFQFTTLLNHTSTQTRVYRDQREVAIFDWTAGTHLGLLKVGQRQVHMAQLVRQTSTNVREFTGPDDGLKFAWRSKTPTQDYELFAPSECRIASYSRVTYQTKWGICHGLLRYTFKDRESLLLEALLALCLNRWIDMNNSS